jgi:outer membrane protein OmpU
MRKIMLAATAIVGMTGLTAGLANAQMPNQPLVSDSFGLNGGFAGYPAPGTVVVRFRARVLTEYGYASDSGDIGKNTLGQKNGSKDGGQYLGTSVRMYPGVDGTLANGLKYGGAIELRVAGGGTLGSTTNTPYVRRASVYVQSPVVGKFIVGQIDGALSQYYNTVQIESFDFAGTSNGSVQFANGGTVVNWPFWENGGAYINNKFVYLSPSFAGFEAGVSYEPTATTNDTNCAQAAPTPAAAANSLGNTTGCPTLSSVPGGANLRKNTVELAARYKGSFGPVAANVEIGYVGSGKVNDSAATAATVPFKGINVYDAGATFTAFGFTVGGHFIGGQMNSNYGLLRRGQKQLQAFLVGANYAWSTFTVGANYLNSYSAGTYNPATNNNALHETAVATGGIWDWAPGSTAYVSAVYMARHQVGVDLLNGAVGNFNNNTQARFIVVGNQFRW